MKKAMVVLSGGLDSTVALYEAIDTVGIQNVEAVSFLYGQKHSKELDAANDITMALGIQWDCITLPSIFGGTDSVLVQSNALDMPEVSYEDINEAGGVSPTYVPYRNGNFLSMATTYAMTRFPDDDIEVWAGMHAEDAHNWAYPDCTPEFIGAMANAMYIGSYHKVRLITPHEWRSKAEVVASGMKLDVPFSMTWSCYNGRTYHCGVCPTCVGRIQAFAINGLRDTAAYEIEIDWSNVAT